MHGIKHNDAHMYICIHMHISLYFCFLSLYLCAIGLFALLGNDLKYVCGR